MSNFLVWAMFALLIKSLQNYGVPPLGELLPIFWWIGGLALLIDLARLLDLTIKLLNRK